MVAAIIGCNAAIATAETNRSIAAHRGDRLAAVVVAAGASFVPAAGAE